MSYAATAQDETEDRYHTQVEAGDVRLFTLDQLDAAFNAGLIHENTYVCLEGSSEWLTLGEVAGLGEEEEPVSAPVPVAAPVSYARPVAPTPNAYGLAASPSVAPAAPYSVAPMVMPRSIAPVSNDLSFDDDMDMMSMRPKRRLGKVIAGLAVVGLAGLGFAVVQSGGIKLPKLDPSVSQASAASLTMSGMKDSSQSSAAKPAPVAEAPKPEAPKAEAAPTTPAEGKTAEADSPAKKAEDRFSEEMKAALLNKDKKQAATQKTKKAARGVAIATKSKAGKSSSGFKAGGSAYDPLNGKL